MTEVLYILNTLLVTGLFLAAWQIARWLEWPVPRKASVVVDGRELSDGPPSVTGLIASPSVASASHFYTWGGSLVSPAEATEHFLILGKTNSGKSILYRALMREALEHLPDDGRLLVFDYKHDYWRMLAAVPGFSRDDDAVLIQPFVEGTPAWDIAADVSLLTTRTVAEGIVATTERSHWSRASVEVLTSILDAFVKLRAPWTLWDLCVACQSIDNMLLLADASGMSPLKTRLSKRQSESDGVAKTLRTAMSGYRHAAALWRRAWEQGKKFSLRPWLASSPDAPRVLVIGYDSQKWAELRPITQALFSYINPCLIAADQPLRKKAPRTWLFLDEFHAAGRVENFSELLTAGRDYGVVTVVGTQALSHLHEHYRQHEVETMFSQQANRAYLALRDDATARWVSDQVGKQIRWERGSSSSRSRGPSGPSTQEGTDERLQERYAVNKETFKQYPPPGPHTPLHACYDRGHVGAWFYKMPPEDFPPETDGDPLPSVDVDEDALRLDLVWNKEDHARLRLKPRTKKRPDAPPADASGDQADDTPPDDDYPSLWT